MVNDGNYFYNGKHFIMYTKVRSLSCTQESNIILYVDYSKKEKKEKIMVFREYERYPNKRSNYVGGLEAESEPIKMNLE